MMTDEKRRLIRAEIDSLKQRVADLEALNARLMGDDEAVPRYTAKRLKHEVAERTKLVEAKAKAAWDVLGMIDTRLMFFGKEHGTSDEAIWPAVTALRKLIADAREQWL